MCMGIYNLQMFAIDSIESQHLQSILKAKLNDLQELEENIVQQFYKCHRSMVNT